jgi:hypothetical protein
MVLYQCIVSTVLIDYYEAKTHLPPLNDVYIPCNVSGNIIEVPTQLRLPLFIVALQNELEAVAIEFRKEGSGWALVIGC